MVTLNSESFNKPIGEAKAIEKMIKLQKKQAPAVPTNTKEKK